jgi:hypothetical protein
VVERSDGSRGYNPRWVWAVRAALALAVLYATYAAIFYGWYASFPGPNREPATLVANIWTVVAIVCIGALALSFVRTKPKNEQAGQS